MNNPISRLIQKIYRVIDKVATPLQPLFLLAIRLYWGWQFFQTGKGKFEHFDRVLGLFTSLHLPLPKVSVILAASTEMIGGLLLLVGLGSRLASIPLLFVMGVAYGTAHLDAVKTIFSDPDKFVTQEPFLFALTTLIVLLFGPGVFSLDHLIKKMKS